MVTNASGPTGTHRRCGPLRPNPPVWTAGGFEVISAKNFRSASISAHTNVVAGSMKPPKTHFEMGAATFVASMDTATGCAAAVPASTNTNVGKRNHSLQLRMSVLRSTGDRR